MTEPSDFNAKIIDEYRAGGGKVGMFPNGSLLRLRSTGAKSGAMRIRPAVILEPVR